MFIKKNTVNYQIFFKERTTEKSSVDTYRKSVLSLKTGLFQWEVASKEESSIWTNRLSVKQDFVYKEEGIIWTELVRWGLPFKKKSTQKESRLSGKMFFKKHKLFFNGKDFFYKEKGIIWTELVRWGLSFKNACYLERKWIIRKNVY